MSAGLFDGDEAATLDLAPGRLSYVHLIRGALTVNGIALQTGDAAMMSEETQVSVSAGKQAEVLVFDLAA